MKKQQTLIPWWFASPRSVPRTDAMMSKSELIAALAEDREPWWLVYPGSEKIDVGDKRVVALVRHPHHGKILIDKLWPGVGYMEPLK